MTRSRTHALMMNGTAPAAPPASMPGQAAAPTVALGF